MSSQSTVSSLSTQSSISSQTEELSSQSSVSSLSTQSSISSESTESSSSSSESLTESQTVSSSWRHAEPLSGDQCDDIDDIFGLDPAIVYVGHSRDIDFASEVPQWYSIDSRFQLNVPQGAVITSAFIRYISAAATPVPFVQNTITIYAYDYDDANNIPATPFAECHEDALDRTSASAIWQPPASPGVSTLFDTADLTAVVQEIVNRPGWIAGNQIQFLLEAQWLGSGNQDLVYEFFNEFPDDIMLKVTWE